MISGKVILLILVQFIAFKGCCCSNTNYTTVEEVITSENTTLLPAPSSIGHEEQKLNKTDVLNPLKIITKNESQSINSSNSNHNQLEVVEIFNSDLNTTTAIISLNDTITNCPNITSMNITCIEQSWNDTIKTNYTTLAEAVGASEDLPPFRLQNTAAVAAGVFLVSAVLGYISCVGYRQFLQRKYGNSQILVGEETYDTTDLKYFEI